MADRGIDARLTCIICEEWFEFVAPDPPEGESEEVEVRCPECGHEHVVTVTTEKSKSLAHNG